MTGSELITQLPALSSNGIVSSYQYYVYGLVLVAIGGFYALPDDDADLAYISRLDTIIGIGPGGDGGNGDGSCYGLCGNAGGLVFAHVDPALTDIKPANVCFSSTIAPVARKRTPHQIMICGPTALQATITVVATEGNRGADAAGSSSIVNGVDGPLKFLWSADDVYGSQEGSSVGQPGGYGPGASGPGGNVGDTNIPTGYSGGMGAHGGIVFCFRLK